MTVNDFYILEDKLDVKFDFVWLTSSLSMRLGNGEKRKVHEIYKYIRDGGTLITNMNFKNKYKDLFKEISEEDLEGEVVSTEIGYIPGRWVNSLTALLWYLSNEGFTSIFLFGCDGGLIQGQKNAYYEEGMRDFVHANRSQIHAKDTDRMNKGFWEWYDKKDRVIKKPCIINVTNDSLVTCFETITWEEFHEVLHVTPEKSF